MAISRSRLPGRALSGRLLPGLGELLADLDRLERQRAGLDGERQLVVVAVDDAAAHRLLDVGDLELARGLGAQPRGARHLQVEQLGRGHDQHQEDHRVAGAVPEHERRAAQTAVGVGCPGATMTCAMIAQGIPINDVTPENLSKVRPVLQQWVKLIKKYDSENPKTELQQGNVDIGIIASGDSALLIAGDKRFKFVVPEEGARIAPSTAWRFPPTQRTNTPPSSSSISACVPK